MQIEKKSINNTSYLFNGSLIKLINKLKNSGLGGAKLFTKDDLENLNPEELGQKVQFIIYDYI